MDIEERRRRLRARDGLRRIGAITQVDALDAVERSIPRLRDAALLFDRVEALLGERAWRDPWATPIERKLVARDAERPEWLVPHGLLYLALDGEEPQHVVPLELPEALRAKLPPAPAPEEPTVVPLAPGGRPGRLRIEAGPAYLDIQYGPTGAWKESSLTSGDPFFFSLQEEEPFVVDTLARPPQAPPLPLFARTDLRPAGHPIDEFARFLVGMETMEPGRVLLPVPGPGGATGTWNRGQWINLRAAFWEGRVGPEAGWVVIDAWNGTAVATGATFDEAVEAWRAQVRAVQPLPPVERPPPAPPKDEPEDELPSAEFDEDTQTARLSSGTMHIVIAPPVQMPWPEPCPENVPAVAVPLPAAPAVPEALARIGFWHVVRLVGEYGEAGFVFVRDEDGGLTLVGDDTLDAIDPATLDADLDRIDAEVRAEMEERDSWFHDRNPYRDPPYPVHVAHYRAWDDTGRVPHLRSSGIAWQAEFPPRGLDIGLRWGIQRVRFLQIGGASR